MSEFQGFSIIKIGETEPIASGLRLSVARRRVEQMNREGKGMFRTEEDWKGVPVTHVDDPRKTF